MKVKKLLIALIAFSLLGLTSCGTVDPSATHYVPASNGKGGVQVAR